MSVHVSLARNVQVSDVQQGLANAMNDQACIVELEVCPEDPTSARTPERGAPPRIDLTVTGSPLPIAARETGCARPPPHSSPVHPQVPTTNRFKDAALNQECCARPLASPPSLLRSPRRAALCPDLPSQHRVRTGGCPPLHAARRALHGGARRARARSLSLSLSLSLPLPLPLSLSLSLKRRSFSCI